jgi:UDP-galactopyranose mutase
MALEVDFLIVGAGLTGATIARKLTDAGCEVLVLERRNHTGGNVHDHLHSSGVRIHTYGPHYFRTNSEEIWQFVNRFAEFFPYEAMLKSLVEGKLEHWPITAEYISRAIGPDWKPSFENVPSNFEEACLATMPRLVYERFVKGYTEKQWRTSARNLSSKLAGRFDVRLDNEKRLSRHKYQGIPRAGYAEFARKLLAGIPVQLNCDFMRGRDRFRARKLLIYTGAIDEFCSYALGKLGYRAQYREHTYVKNTQYLQPCGQINNPSKERGTHIRTLEWKHMMAPEDAVRARGTVITREYPFTPLNSDQYEYPIPDERNQLLYQAYRARVAGTQGLMICGRLGEYRYFDMDQAIGRALRLTRDILNIWPVTRRQFVQCSRTQNPLLNTARNMIAGGERHQQASR